MVGAGVLPIAFLLLCADDVLWNTDVKLWSAHTFVLASTIEAAGWNAPGKCIARAGGFSNVTVNVSLSLVRSLH